MSPAALLPYGREKSGLENEPQQIAYHSCFGTSALIQFITALQHVN